MSDLRRPLPERASSLHTNSDGRVEIAKSNRRLLSYRFLSRAVAQSG